MKIRTKLVLALGIPIAGLLILGGVVVRQSFHNVAELGSVSTLTDFGVRVSLLIHETQKERGATAGFLGSSGEKFGGKLVKQRELTNAELAQFKEFLATLDAASHGESFESSVVKASELLTKLLRVRSSVDSLEASTGEAIGYYTAVNTALLDATGKASAATSNGEIAARLDAYNSFLKAKERAGIERAVLANTFSADRFGPGMYDKFTKLVALQTAYFNEFKTVATASDRGFFEETLEAPCVEEVERYRKIAVDNAETGGFGADAAVWFDTITKKINLLKQVDNELAQRLRDHTSGLDFQAKSALAWTIGLVGVATALALLFGATAIRSTIGRLSDVTARVRDIAEGEGDLQQRLAVADDELGEVAQWFNRFMEKLEETIRSIATSARELTEGASAMQATSESLERGAGESRQQAATIAAASEEMSCTLGQVSESADQLAEGMRAINDSVDSISQSIEQIADKSRDSAQLTEAVNARVGDAHDRIGALGVAASEIESVVTLIEEIAEQTNLLALNATIEAARAGEAGKGFAVVATEVKELANQSAKATEGIRERVSAMQSGATNTGEALTEIETTIRDVTSFIDTIDAAIQEQNESVRSISGVVGESTETTESVNANLRETAAASEEVARGATSVNAATNETADSAQQTSVAGQRVAELAGTLNSLAGQFRYRD